MSSMNMTAINLYTNFGHKLFMQGKVYGLGGRVWEPQFLKLATCLSNYGVGS